MGTVSIDNSGVESRLDNVESKVSENTGALNLGFNNIFSRMAVALKELRIFNLHQSKISGEVFTEEDVEDDY